MGVLGRENEEDGKCACNGSEGSREDSGGKEVDFQKTRACCAEPEMHFICFKEKDGGCGP